MAEVETELAPTEVKQVEKPKIVSAGKPQIVNTQKQSTESVVDNTKEGAQATQEADKGVSNEGVETPAPTSEKKQEPTETPELTEAQLASFFEKQGIKFEGLDKLKEKINYEPAQEPTEEEKAKQALVREKRLVDLFVAGGGTVEQYVYIKNTAEANAAELSKNNLRAELKAAGFTDEQADEYIKDSFFQISDEELEQYEDETDKEFLKRKKEFASKKLEGYSSNTKTQAQKILADLQKAAETEDLQRSEEVAISAKIDEDFKALPRKLTFDIGEVNGKAVSPVEYEVSESDLAEVRDMLKDPVKRNNFLFNQDGALNLTNLENVLTRNKYLESAVKAAYHEGGSRQVAHFESIFPARSAQELGVGGSPTANSNQKGKVAGYGKPRLVRSQQHN
jgi:hypothetical protein